MRRHLLTVLACVLVFSVFGINSPAIASEVGSVDPTLNVPPPPGFNPLMASDAELKEYGFPHRPSDATALATWNSAMQHARQYLTPRPQLTGMTRGIVYSKNWAGYFDPASGNFSGVVYETTAEWSVPSVPTSSLTPIAAFWTGIGGVGSPDIVQAGSDSRGFSTAQYTLWTEDAPQFLVDQSNPPISPGNTVYVDVSYNSSNQQATYFMENMSTEQYTSYTAGAPYYFGQTADYINEKDGSYLPNFGTVHFTDCILYWRGSGSGGGDFGAYNSTESIMLNSGTIDAQPSAIGSDHASFSVTWKHQ